MFFFNWFRQISQRCMHGNMRFRQPIFIGLVFTPFCSKRHKNISLNSQDPHLCDYEKVTLIHLVLINPRWHAKIIIFFIHLYVSIYDCPNVQRRGETSVARSVKNTKYKLSVAFYCRKDSAVFFVANAFLFLHLLVLFSVADILPTASVILYFMISDKTSGDKIL